MKELFVSLLFPVAREARTKFPLRDISLDPLISRAQASAHHPIPRSGVYHNEAAGL